MANLIGNLQGAGEAVKEVGGIVGGLGKTVLDIGKGIKTLITGKLDPETQNTFDLQWAQVESALMAQQNKINELEAQSSRLWVSGWRPYLGWIAGTVIGATYLPHVLLSAAMWTRQVIMSGIMIPYPAINIADVIGILGTLLGAGWTAYLRTQEKVAGIQGRH